MYKITMHSRHFCTVLSVLLLGSLLSGFCFWKAETDRQAETSAIQQELSGSLLRLHIIANSDSSADQGVKLLVRNAILDTFGDAFTAMPDKKTAQQLAENLLSQAEAVANEVLEKNGFSYTASASLAYCYFPEKTYAEYTFPAGYYDALRITLGDAVGHNWWCVLYPPLCFTDISTGSMPDSSEELLEQHLSQKTFRQIHQETDSESEEEPKIGFRLLSFLRNIFSDH